MILLLRPSRHLFPPFLPSLKYSFITLYNLLLVRYAPPTIFDRKRETFSSLFF